LPIERSFSPARDGIFIEHILIKDFSSVRAEYIVPVGLVSSLRIDLYKYYVPRQDFKGRYFPKVGDSNDKAKLNFKKIK
jgi:hypothetical protein